MAGGIFLLRWMTDTKEEHVVDWLGEYWPVLEVRVQYLDVDSDTNNQDFIPYPTAFEGVFLSIVQYFDFCVNTFTRK